MEDKILHLIREESLHTGKLWYNECATDKRSAWKERWMSIRQMEKNTTLYERLSSNDELDWDSNYIINQKKMLEDYAREYRFVNCQHFTDDGLSGGNFERLSWKGMVEDIEDRKIGILP